MDNIGTITQDSCICKINVFYDILQILMIEELRRFILVVSNGNLTKTAEKIFITQSALTQSVQRLEKELATKLFTQKGKTLHVTTDGLAVAALGEKILSLWDKAKDPTIRGSIRQTFTIGAFDNAALRLGKYFQNNMQHDIYDLELVIGSSSKLFSELQLGLLDMTICVIDKKNLLNKNYILLKTFRERLIPVSSKRFKGAVKDIPFILYNKGSFTRDYIDSQFTETGIIPKVFAESTSVTFMKELANLGCGVALLPENSVRAELQQNILKKQHLPYKWYREYGIYLPRNGQLKKEDLLVTEIIENLID